MSGAGLWSALLALIIGSNPRPPEFHEPLLREYTW